jgi:hypothetical protein
MNVLRESRVISLRCFSGKALRCGKRKGKLTGMITLNLLL